MIKTRLKLFTPSLPWSLCFVRIIFLIGFCKTFFVFGKLFLIRASTCTGPWLPISYFQLSEKQICINSNLALILYYGWLGSLFFALIGLYTRRAIIVAFILSLLIVPFYFNFGLLHHLTHFPIVILGILAFSHCGDFLSVDALLRKWRGQIALPLTSPEYNWPLALAKVYTVLIYFIAGLQKFKNSGFRWFESENMQILLLTRPTLTAPGFWVATHPKIAAISALAIMLVQIGAPLALLHTRWALLCVPSLVGFHLTSFWLMGAHGNFFSHIWALTLWLPINEIIVWRNRKA